MEKKAMPGGALHRPQTERFSARVGENCGKIGVSREGFRSAHIARTLLDKRRKAGGFKVSPRWHYITWSREDHGLSCFRIIGMCHCEGLGAQRSRQGDSSMH